jgi:Cu/Ag efflux protein CusF
MRRNLTLVLAIAFVLVFAVQVSAAEMKGVVKAIDTSAKTVTVKNFVFEAGNVDLSKIKVGDTVKVTYEVKDKKNILKSIVKEKFVPLEGC